LRCDKAGNTSATAIYRRIPVFARQKPCKHHALTVFLFCSAISGLKTGRRAPTHHANFVISAKNHLPGAPLFLPTSAKTGKKPVQNTAFWLFTAL